MTVVDPEVVTQMVSIVPGHSAEAIQSQFGISLNTLYNRLNAYDAENPAQ